jgi:hypothetical protein|tara:strand:+ start:241 stop:816 length:576 start_codon:yes stop_codon:yes gene_type:complete
MSTIIYHTHHIVPRYRCKEIGIDPDFPENLIRLTEKEHGQAHYERWLKHKRKEDLWAAILVGKGQIEGLDQSGENSYWYGREKPPEMRAKISKTLKEKWKNGSFKNRLSEEGRKRISEAAKGRVWTEEQRKKASEAQMGEKNSQYGKPKSPETKAKMRAATLRNMTPETRKKISEGVKRVNVAREKMREVS